MFIKIKWERSFVKTFNPVIVGRVPVSELVHSYGVVCRVLGVAGVGIVVILRQQVDVMQENTAPVLLFQRLPHSNIQ